MDITLIRDSESGNITGAVYYPYNPSQSAAYAFVAIFAGLTVAHMVYMFPLRSWFFVSFILGGICETFGYYGRAKSRNNVSKTGPWMLQNVFILGAPTFFAATVYMTLARFIVALNAEHHAIIAPRWITRIYITIDVLCFLSQFAGAGVQASGDNQVIAIGNKVILGGLIFQLIAFGFFIIMAWRIHVGLKKEDSVYNQETKMWGRAKKYFWALYVVSLCFMLRNLIRAIEYGQIANGGGFSWASRNPDGSLTYEEERETKISDNETWLYVFDAAMMAIIVVSFLVMHPGRLVKWSGQKQQTRLLDVEMDQRT